MRAILRRDEPEGVYRELVDGLADNVMPMLVLCVLLMATGTYVLSIVPSPFVLVATAVSVAAALVKIALIWHHHRHRAAYRGASLATVRRHEAMHGASTVAVGLAVGFFAASVYVLPQTALHALPVCISFGYSAGLISRVSIRPHIASGAILGMGVPSVVTMALVDTPAHLMIAVVFSIFVCAGFQSVAFVYETAKRGVTLRLQLEAAARRDALTGLLNRFGLCEACSALPNDGRMVAIHAFDLDGFKRINDDFGHAAGDRLLAALAERIRAIVPAGTIAARIGGDEFVLVQTGIQGEEDARRLAEHLHRDLTRLRDIGARMAKVGLSIGYSVGPLGADAFRDLLQKADEASYAVKREGGGVRSSLERPLPLLAALA